MQAQFQLDQDQQKYWTTMYKATNILLIITSGLILFGMIAKSMHWPGGSISIILGTMLSWIALLLYFIGRAKNKTKAKIATYSVYFYLFSIFSGITLFSAINMTKDVLNAFVDVSHSLENINHGLLEQLSESAHSKKVIKVYNNIEDHKTALISSGLLTGDEEKNLAYDLLAEFKDDRGYPLNKDNQDIASTYFMVQDGGINGDKLENELLSLYDYYAPLLQNNPKLLTFKPEDRVGYEPYSTPWINYLCDYVPLSTVLARLSIIQNQILNCEIATQTL